ncbi:SusC/RagA family TonB-linked outer membrane protein [Neotamlana laminarinivorans]|uniref:TonB-dependent receptor n=1 Tax=Neotamlana laminarinivorans TaxID=2883124 RepID=A0A9X1HZA8_9FLAO|nr:TonB-dependent receptor [Tamlana laminarinivorans]MCB4798080.1 TonB-dependent receptor [Tamlana laminarinivorans]
MKNRLLKKLILPLFIIIESIAYAQSVSGTVTDNVGVPIPGVNVLIKNSNNGTVTDFDGKFEVSISNGNILVFSYLGYQTKELTYNGQDSLNIILNEDTSELDEVVVVGYGTKKKSLLTGAISSVDTKAIESASNQRVEQVLQGRTSGVTVMSSSGAPGSGAQIRIRGTGSSGSSGPLYIVDGMKTSSIVDIAPGDIANMEILKDAASAAIYGTEGANGVVIITTKRGRTGGIKVGFNTQLGTQWVNTDMELMNASQFVEYMNEAGITSVEDNGYNTNWINETFSSAPTRRFDVNVSGATDTNKHSFYFSASNLKQDGVVAGDNSSFNRTTMRLNLKSQLADWMEVGGNMSLSSRDRFGIAENSDTRGVIQNMLIIDPLTPVFYNEGEVPQDVIDRSNDNNVPLITDGNGRVYGYPSFSTGEVINPVAYANELNISNFIGSQFLSTVYLTLKPIEGLELTTRYGYERGNTDNRNTVNPYYVSSEAANTSYTGSQTRLRNRRWLWENFATYTKSFGNHNFKALVGYSAEDSDTNTIISRTFSIPVEDFTGFDFYDNSLPGQIEYNAFPYLDNLASFYGRLSYNFNDKYLFEASYRADTSDKFPSENKTGYFPAFSAGWVVSNEDFWNEDSKISYLKLRASWGQNGSKANLPGNSDITGITLIGEGYLNQDIVYEGNNGAQITGYGNSNLVWETSEQLDLGIDIKAFNNRLRFSTDYYIKTTRDLLVSDGSLITPGSAGFNFEAFNGGTIENSGFEFEIGYSDSNSKGFTYDINLNLSTLKNEVKEIKLVPEGTSLVGASAPQNPDGVTRFTEGLPAWYFYGYKTDGIDPNTGEVILVDNDGNGTVNNLDKTFIGTPHPDVLFGGNIALGYKALDFNLQFQGTLGNDIMATYHQPSRPITNKPLHFYTDRWQQAGDNASLPGAEHVISSYDTDLVVEDGSYMRIKQIQLGYTLPQHIIQNSKLKNLRVYVSLDDYFTFTKYKGLDPEIGNFSFNSVGIDRGFYPTAARAILGLSLNLF